MSNYKPRTGTIDGRKVTEFVRYKDGGTCGYRDEQDRRYYVDGRINSKTKGRVFSVYPSDDNIKPLDVVFKLNA